MTPGQRRWIFLVAGTGLVVFYLWGLLGLPGFGHYPGPYGLAILRVVVAQTNATGAVSAINFEYRGFDTVGEEFILFVAAAGVAAVLRLLRGERERPAWTRRRPGCAATSGAVRMVALLFTGPVVLAGLVAGVARADQPVGRVPGRGHAGHRVRPDLPGRRVPCLQAVQPGRSHRRRGGGGGRRASPPSGFSAVAMGLPYLKNFLPLG